MARELKGLLVGLAAGLGVLGTAYGVSAIVAPIVAHSQPAEAKQVPAAKASGGQVASTQLVAMGRGLYVVSCAVCHGSRGQGQNGPSLHALGDPDAKIARNIKNGFPPRMPAFKNTYNDAQTNALVAYVQSLK
jgi:mono/diheme cytochrome c family protein